MKRRWSARKKAAVILRLLRGGEIETVSRTVQVPVFELLRVAAGWLCAGQAPEAVRV